MSTSLSIVIPTAFQQRTQGIFDRVVDLVESNIFAGQQVIVSHAATDSRVDRRFQTWLTENRRAGRLDFVWKQRPPGRLPLGELRNWGAELAEGKFLIFVDADLALPANFVGDLLGLLEAPASLGFAIIPCLYATQAGTKALATSAEFDKAKAVGAYYQHRRELITHLAINTSTVALPTATFRDLGGFDARFLDHGLEDFELLIRLALARSKLAIPADILDDTPVQSPAFSRGFRSYLDLLSLPVFLEGLCTLHRWHARPVGRAYYQNRTANRVIFDSNIREAVAAARAQGEPQLETHLLRADGTYDSLRAVTQMIAQASLELADPSALFDNLPQYLFNRDRTRRKVAKVMRSWFRRPR